MKQNMKRLWLMVCMVCCLLALTACSAAEQQTESLDAEISQGLCSVTEGILQLCTELSAEEIEQAEASALKQKDNVTAGLFTAWKGVMADAGDFVEVLSSEAMATDEGYACVVTASFAQRKVEFKAFYEDGAQGMPVPTSFSFTPEYTTGEKLAKAGMNTVMGMGTVFLVLIFISLIISCFKFINAFENRAKAAAPAVTPAPAAPAAPAVVEEDLTDDLELVAVITAAIAAFDNTSADGLVVRSIKRAPGAKWKRA